MSDLRPPLKGAIKKPDPDPPKGNVNPAVALAERRRKEREEANKAARAEQEKKLDLVYYVECTDSECSAPGIWIGREPIGQLADGDWWASYKDRGRPWPSNQIPCQVCYEQGRTTFLPMLHERGKPVAIERHVKSITRAEYEALQAEGGE